MVGHQQHRTPTGGAPFDHQFNASDLQHALGPDIDTMRLLCLRKAWENDLDGDVPHGSMGKAVHQPPDHPDQFHTGGSA